MLVMNLRVLKLGTECRDKATGLKGTLTHWMVNMGRNITYIFQPIGLDEEGQPVDKLWVERERLDIGEDSFETVEVPFEILGTFVRDKPSGFEGMAVEFVRHINGCFHVVIQPKGKSPKTHNHIRRHDFDLRECTGKMIVQLSQADLKRSQQEKPSPSGGDVLSRDLPVSVTGSHFRR